MKFLETVTFDCNDVLVPINRIKYINFSYDDGHIIKIYSDNGEWHECFGKDEEKAIKRYKMIKDILDAQ